MGTMKHAVVINLSCFLIAILLITLPFQQVGSMGFVISLVVIAINIGFLIAVIITRRKENKQK